MHTFFFLVMLFSFNHTQPAPTHFKLTCHSCGIGVKASR